MVCFIMVLYVILAIRCIEAAGVVAFESLL